MTARVRNFPSRELSTAQGPVAATIDVPGSKSVTNRILVCAALARGESTVTNIAPGDDSRAMLNCLPLLGVQVNQEASQVSVLGVDGRPHGGRTLDSELAGTTSRFLTAMACLGEETTVVTGREGLKRRPMSDLHRALIDLGAHVRSLESSGHLPVEVSRAHLTGGAIQLRGDVSSQFLSGLMMIAPYLAGGLTIDITTSLVSRPYVEMTVRVMEIFGIGGIELEDHHVRIEPGSYSGTKISVEPDASSASYPLAAAAITGGRIRIAGLNRGSLQGDIRFLDILDSMGCAVREVENDVEVQGGEKLHGIDIDMRDISDLVPTVAALAMFASTESRIRGVGFIRAKESDRLRALVDGINSLGGRCQETEDGMIIWPSQVVGFDKVVLPTFDDHRLAMAWSLVALKRPGVSVENERTVEKSWPLWWKVREQLVESSRK